MKKPALIIMAAGMGSRYGGLKQMDPVGPNGELIIDYSIFDALRAGFGKIVFVINKSKESDFRQVIGRKIEKQCETQYVYQALANLPEGFQVPVERRKPWGTGHATLLCKDMIDTPFAVINADDFYGHDSFRVLQYFLSSVQNQGNALLYSMVGFKIENTLTDHGYVARGVCDVDENGDLRHIKERTHIQKSKNGAKYTEDEGITWTEIPPGSFVSLNAWGFTPSIFNELEQGFLDFLLTSQNLDKAEFFLPEVVGDLLKAGRACVKVLPTEERWVGVTYKADKPMVEQYIGGLVRAGFYPEKLWE